MSRILFFAEAVTSAHLFRPYWLAKKLAAKGMDVHLATTQNHKILDENHRIQIHHIDSDFTSAEFVKCVRNGKMPFTEQVVRNNMKRDRDLLEKIKPDVVIDDFRLSLSLSTEIMNIPQVTINNVTWSPSYQRRLKVVPDVNVVETLGPKVGGFLFTTFSNVFQRNILKPFSKLRRELKLNPLHSVFELYNGGSQVGYLDIPEFTPGIVLPENHSFLGPLLFSFPCPMPTWWNEHNRDRPLIYISLGSSGRADLTPMLLKSLEGSNYEIIVSTAGRDVQRTVAKNIHYATYLPDHEILPHCQLYVGNGGSGGAQSALAAGTPLLALPDNYDQWLYSDMLSQLNLIEVLRPSTLTGKQFRTTVDRMLSRSDPSFNLSRISKAMSAYDTVENLVTLIADTTIKKPVFV